MATAQPETTLKGLECSICTETFNEPKLLECLHSFCKKCLKEYHKSDSSVISCPICRGETSLPPLGIDSLRTNFSIVGLIDEMSMQNKLAGSDTSKPRCEVCEEDSEATHHCTDCSQDICTACLKTHKRFAATREHITASLEDIRQGKINVKRRLNVPKCNRHRNDIKLFYCATCEELICGNCTVLDHCKPQHDVIDYKNAADQRRQGLDEMLPDLNQIITDLNKSVDSTPAIRQKLDQNILQTIKQVNEETDKLIAKIKDEQKRLIDQIKQEKETRHQTLDEHDKTARAMLERLNHSLDTAKGLIQTTSDWDFLSVFPMIDQDIKSLMSVGFPEEDDGLSYLRLLAGCGTIGDIDLGVLELEVPNWKLGLDIGKGVGGGYFDVCFVDPDRIAVADSNGRRVVTYNTNGNRERVIQWENRNMFGHGAVHATATPQQTVYGFGGVHATATPQQTGRRGIFSLGSPTCSSPLQTGSSHGFSLGSPTCSSPLQTGRNAVTRALPAAAIEQEIGNMFGYRAVQASAIPKETEPLSIAAINGQLVVVGGTDHVKGYTKEGRLACTFPTVDTKNGKTAVALRSVAVRRNVILVGDIERKVVTEHHPDGSLIRTIAVATPPRYMAVYTNNRLVVSGGGQHVDIVDNNGTTLFTIKPVIKDHQNPTCRGVCCHATDIYIAVMGANNGHIHRYDSKGRFISCVVDGLYAPCGITQSPNNRLMAVADWQSMKIYNKV